MSEFEKQTRAVFHRHHRVQDEHEQIFKRLIGLIDEEYFGLPAGSFAEMDGLDAGCGSNGNCSFALLANGMRHVTALDLGDEWVQHVSHRLAPFEGRFTCTPASVMSLPFEQPAFDFVHCAGVLHHISDPRRGFDELARVVRAGGYLFVTIMGTGNGVLYKCINLLRDQYQRDPAFKAVIDGLDGQSLRDGVEWLLAEKARAEPERIEGENDVFASLFDTDLVLTIADRLQAPTYHDFAFSEDQIRSWFGEAGLTDIRRITRYTHDFGNLRRFLAPMYLRYDHPISRFWFGEGYIQMIGRKT